jgi:ABC-type multidrug transport system fused ATPase/permease subunit
MLTAPLSFFEQQPVGRILNRMSTDMDLVDTRLMNAVEMALSNVTAFIASLCLVASSAFVTIGLLLPFIFVIGWIQAQFRV